MEKQFSTLWQPAFPNVPIQTKLGTPIFQPGISKYEFVTLQIVLKQMEKSGPLLPTAMITAAKEAAKQFIDAFDKEAEMMLKVQMEKNNLNI